VLLPPDHGVRQLLGRVEVEGDFRLIIRLESGSFELHRRFIVAGLGVGFMPRFVVTGELKAGTVRAVPLKDIILSEVRSHLLLRSGRRLPEATRRLLNHLAQQLVAFQESL
jgi:DNA-binding transcriptional LysR family regulator